MSGLGSNGDRALLGKLSPGMIGSSTIGSDVAGQEAENDQPSANPGLSTIRPARSVDAQLARLAVGHEPGRQRVAGGRGLVGPGHEPELERAVPRLQSHRGQAVRARHPFRERVAPGRDDRAPGDRAFHRLDLQIGVRDPQDLNLAVRQRYQPQRLKDRPLVDDRARAGSPARSWPPERSRARGPPPGP